MTSYIILDSSNCELYLQKLLQIEYVVKSMSTDHAKIFSLLIDHLRKFIDQQDSWGAVALFNDTVVAACCGQIQGCGKEHTCMYINCVINCSKTHRGEASRLIEFIFKTFGADTFGFKLGNAAGLRGFNSYTRAAANCNLNTFAINYQTRQVELAKNECLPTLFITKHSITTIQSLLFPPPLFDHQHPMLPSKKSISRFNELRKKWKKQ